MPTPSGRHQRGDRRHPGDGHGRDPEPSQGRSSASSCSRSPRSRSTSCSPHSCRCSARGRTSSASTRSGSSRWSCTETLSLICFWNLQRIALRTKAWFSVATSQLASGAMTSIIPGGTGRGRRAAVQDAHDLGDRRDHRRVLDHRALAADDGNRARSARARAARDPHRHVGARRASPKRRGSAPPRSCSSRSAPSCLLIFDRPLEIVGMVIQKIRNRFERKKEPITDLPFRLVRERDTIRRTMGSHLGAAVLSAAGRSLFDYLTLARRAHRRRSASRSVARAARLRGRPDPRDDPRSRRAASASSRRASPRPSRSPASAAARPCSPR